MLPAEAYLPDGPHAQRHGDRADRLHHRAGQEAEAVDDLSDDGGPQLLRDPARHRRAPGLGEDGVATPADWQPGDDVIIPVAVKDDEARAKFGEFTTVLPYLRKTKLPA
jgi:hypothetical protein